MKNPKIEVHFENRILSVKFLNNAIIKDIDIEELYKFGDKKASGKPYCIIFEPENHYEVTEDAIESIVDNPHTKDIIAKAYVINSKEAEMKNRLHLAFDNPSLRPFTFKSYEEGKNWLLNKLETSNS
jgi:hypothetical protein